MMKKLITFNEFQMTTKNLRYKIHQLVELLRNYNATLQEKII